MNSFDKLPQIVEHDGIFVVRDDLYPGGTKSRIIEKYFTACVTQTYAYPATAFGAAIVALAHSAVKLNKYVIIFIAKRGRETFTEFMKEAESVADGCIEYRFVDMGFYPNVKRACRNYCEQNQMEVIYIPPGVDTPWAVNGISDICKQLISIHGQFDTVFSVCGSGTLQRGLQLGGLGREYFAVGTGQKNPNCGRATLIEHYNIQKFEQKAKLLPPFPTVPNYDGKGWKYCVEYKQKHPDKKILFWNVYATETDRKRIL